METVQPDLPDQDDPTRRRLRRARLALSLAAATVGESRIGGVPDVAMLDRTVKALSGFGVRIDPAPGGWTVRGLGWGGLLEPAMAIDVGGDRDLLAALMGLAAPQPLLAVFTGAPGAAGGIGRLMAPLSVLGARITQAGGGLPLVQVGAELALPWSYRLGGETWVADALLLAALGTAGETGIEGVAAARLHLDLFQRFGAEVLATEVDGVPAIRVVGQRELAPATVDLSE